MKPENATCDIEKSFSLASQHFQAGRLSTANEIYQQILVCHPDHPRALHALGVLAHCSGNGEAALPLIRRAIAVKPDFPDAFNNLGNILKSMGRREEAIDCYRSAVGLRPDFAMAYYNLGNAVWETGMLDEAIACFHSALTIKPDYPDALNDLGTAYMEQGNMDEAAACFKKTLAVSPESAGTLNNLGSVFMDQGKLAEAIDCFHAAIALKPDYAKAHTNLGAAYEGQGMLDAAIASYIKSIELNPDNALAFNNLGNAFRDMERLGEAVAAYERAIVIQPDYHEAYNSLAVTLAEQGRLAEALENYRKSLALKPSYAPAHSNLIFNMNYMPDISAEEIFRESCRWDRIHAGSGTGRNIIPCRDPRSERRLRIGYVSPDFREHSVSYFFEALLASHNRDMVEVFCYSDVLKPDKITRRLKKHADKWLACIGLSDESLAARIKRDRIDILVDLAGHTARNRLAVFAERAAPVQVTWLGYPNTTGISSMDYRLTDATADPVGSIDCLYTEKLIRLPETFLCYGPPASCPRVSPLPAYLNGYVTFGSFNNLTKITPEVIALWGVILKRIPGSRLILKSKALADAFTRNRYMQAFDNNGINAERVELLSFEPTTKSHLLLYHRIDIALDPFPYNGTTTTCEALWMGVPVITLSGDRHAARVGTSILNSVGLTEHVAKTPTEYTEIAATQAKDLAGLAALRRTLRKQVASSPLCNAKGFAVQIESAYRKMWLNACTSHLPPALTGTDNETVKNEPGQAI